MYAEVLSDVLSYATGSAAADAIERLLEPADPNPTTGVTERARDDRTRNTRVRLSVATLVAAVLTVALFRGR